MSAARTFLPGLAAIILLATTQFVSATVGIYPQGLTFPSAPVGTPSPLQYVTVYNVGINTFTVETATTNSTQYTFTGTLPVSVAPGQYTTFQVQFTPATTGLINGTLTFTFTGATKQIVNLSGIGTNTTALPALSATSMNFGNQGLGSNGPAQKLTITNNGTSTVKLTGVTITAPFVQTGFTAQTSIAAGKSYSMSVYFYPNILGATSGTISLTYDIAPTASVSLWGTATTPTGFGLTSYPNLPTGTINYPYETTLTAAGGTPPYSWSVGKGAAIPTGLTLSTTGAISGTLSSSLSAKTYSFNARVQDSSIPARSATQAVLLSANASIGANCNNISYNASDGSGPLVPITDLGTGFYLGSEEGGIYANGSNVDDAGHNSYGQGLAAGIQPLDINGNPSPTGKYVLLGIGLSVTEDSLDEFVPLANADPAKNPNLVVVNGGTGGATAGALTSTTNNVFWEAIINDYLPNAGVTPQQVVGIWFMDVDGGPAGTFPTDMTQLQSQMETDAQNALLFFPNLKIGYATSIYYEGFANGVVNLDPEPYAYESGFAVKNMIQDQINGNANLNFNPLNGPVLAPWLAWGPYIWANGMISSMNGTNWTCHDMQSDGTHPNAGARLKVAQQVLNFLKTDSTATPWFLVAGSPGRKN